MKRSDMVKLIAGLFSIANRFPDEMNAENLLVHLEEKGMLPPGVLMVKELQEPYTQYDNIPVMGQIVEVNKWDEDINEELDRNEKKD